MLDLVEDADVLVEGMRPGATERLGLGPDECLARNPRLVYGRMTGWGQDGPLAQTAGHDMNYIAITGALFGLGQDQGRPHFPTNLVGDFGGGSTYLVIGVLAALLEARVSRRGAGRRRRDRRRHRAPQRDGAGFLRRRRLPASSGRPTCSTAACRSTTSTRPPTAGTCRSAPLEPQFYDVFVDLLGIAGTRPDRNDLASARRAARGSSRRRFAEPHPGRVDRGLRGHRRLRRAGSPAHRGVRAPAPGGPRGVRRARRRSCSRRRPRASPAPPAVARHRGRRRRRATPARRWPPGASTTSTP